jgi:hypothetical protein
MITAAGSRMRQLQAPASKPDRRSGACLCGLVCIANLLPMETAYPGDDPHRLLSNTRELAQRVREQQRATWFPLLVFAALTFASIPIRRYSSHHLDCVAVPRVCTVYSDAEFVYWPIALVLAYVVIAAFYIHRSRARGVGTRVWPYVIAGIIVAVVLTVVALWEVHSPPVEGPTLVNGLPIRLASPGAAIGLALLVLAWAERNGALLLLTLAYLAVVLVPLTFGGAQHYDPWYSLPVVFQGTVLLLGGIGFAIAQRPVRSPEA